MGTFSDKYIRYARIERVFNFLDKFNVNPLYWAIIVIAIICIDYLSGPWIQFPILFLIPIALASWRGTRKYAMILSVILPCCRIVFNNFWIESLPMLDVVINAIIRMILFSTVAYMVSFVKELHILKGLLHICSYCGRFKSEDGHWISPQEFIMKYSEAMLSHGVCPDCYPKAIGDLRTS